MADVRLLLRCLLLLASQALRAADSTTSSPLRFEVTIKTNLVSIPQHGRLFVILARTNNPEPRLTLGRTGLDAPQALGRDLNGFAPGATAVLDESAFTFPIANLSQLFSPYDTSPIPFVVQALFDSNIDLRSPNAPGNLYSPPQKVTLAPGRGGTVKLELSRQIPPQEVPADSAQVKFVELQSRRLSEFHGRPIFLRAGVVLPRDFEREASRRYPVWLRIGGFNARYTTVTNLMAKKSGFKKTWLADETPRLLLLQLDGAGPYGDPYQINSENNGPYGDAVVEELIPYVEAKFRGLVQAHARVLSGTSTGGWVALALQIFYPDHFNGAWASCPDPVDFRAFELLNIYEDQNAYLNNHGYERPSARDLKGDVSLTMRREVQMENLLGRGDSYTLSGQQWGAWNAVFSPRGLDGLPVPLWDPRSGKINRGVAENWKKYDLRLVLEQNWKTLVPKLRGKLHIAAGEADQYFLNNAVHLLDQFLSSATAGLEGKIVYGPGKGHGWTNLSLREMLEEMQLAVETPAH